MGRHTNILDGAQIADISLAEGGYNYYGYVRTGGTWIIMRENTAQTEYRYKVGASDYATAFTNRTDPGYGLPLIS